MRLFPALAALVGLALMTALVGYFGVAAVTRPLVAIGWSGLAVICAIHLALVVVMGIGWALLLPGTSLWVPVWGRFVRDSGSELLPLSQVGGYVLGARAVTLAGVAAITATASTIVDVTLELFGQLAYTSLSSRTRRSPGLSPPVWPRRGFLQWDLSSSSAAALTCSSDLLGCSAVAGLIRPPPGRRRCIMR